MKRNLLRRLLFVGLLGNTILLGCGNDNANRDDGGTGGGTDSGGGDDGNDGSGGGGGQGGSSGSPCGELDSSWADADPEALFEGDRIPLFEFHLPDDEWEDLQKNARDEEYVEAEACYQGKSLGVVGLRFKGGYGTLLSCFDENDELVCNKLSMKVKFDEVTDDGRFFRQEKLNFHSMIRDPSQIRERLAYDLYRQMGVPAPRSSWARLRVNGEDRGLFSMVEDIDDRFVVNHFPGDDEGDLYKEAWPVTTEVAYYADRAETNEDTSTHQDYATFAGELLAASDATERAAVLARWFETDSLARYLAVDDALLNWDGITAFYAVEGETWVGNHNYYVYQLPSTGRFQLIPWDMDNTLRVSAPMNHVPHWTERPDDCSERHLVFPDGTRVMAPGCDPLLDGFSPSLASYRAALTELLAGPFEEERLLALIDESVALLEDAVEGDPHGPGVEAWRAGVESLRRDIPLLRARAESLLEGEVPNALRLDPDATNGFEGVTELELALGTTLLSNSTTSVRGYFDGDDPLDGDQSLALEFEFRNDTTPWNQWIYFSIPFREQRDLSSFEGVRFLARADSNRLVRIDVESPAHTRTAEGIRFGWDLLVTPTSQVHELSFLDLTLPAWAAPSAADDREAVLQSVNGLALSPHCQGRNDLGLLPVGTTDPGTFVVDAIELY